MDFNSLLLIAVIWLLWNIHQDLTESNDRQRGLKTTINKLANRFEQYLEQDKSSKPARKTSSKAKEKA